MLPATPTPPPTTSAPVVFDAEAVAVGITKLPSDDSFISCVPPLKLRGWMPMPLRHSKLVLLCSPKVTKVLSAEVPYTPNPSVNCPVLAKVNAMFARVAPLAK